MIMRKIHAIFRSAIAAASIASLCALAPGATMPSLDGGSAWIGSKLQSTDLRGKVVLVDFWEYTCLNCLRTLPYLREWYKRYQSEGLVIVGVQSPEFTFSGQVKPTSDAAQRLDVTWPVVIDDRHAIWNRYDVKVWPTEMLFDQQGRLVTTHLGEGGYPEMEREIQKLIHVDHPQATMPQPMALLPQDSYDKPGAVCYPQTSEILVEAGAIANAPSFGNPSQDLEYSDRGSHKDGAVYLDGFWRNTREAVVFGGGKGSLLLPYHAIEVQVVMTPGHSSSRVNVEQDGKPIAREDAGEDVQYDSNGRSYVSVNASRAYQLLMNKAFGQHELRLQPDGAGLAVYDIAFESCEAPHR
jgi:thiol-disulfide isomerase/thioredoxin